MQTESRKRPSVQSLLYLWCSLKVRMVPPGVPSGLGHFKLLASGSHRWQVLPDGPTVSRIVQAAVNRTELMPRLSRTEIGHVWVCELDRLGLLRVSLGGCGELKFVEDEVTISGTARSLLGQAGCRSALSRTASQRSPSDPFRAADRHDSVTVAAGNDDRTIRFLGRGRAIGGGGGLGLG